MDDEKTVPDDAIKAFLKILEGPYEHARAGIIDLETSNLEMAYLSIREIRDAFDHIFLAFCDGNGWKAHLESSEEHLRRAAVESYELIAEDKLIGLLPLIDKPFLLKLAFIKTPISGVELKIKIKDIKANIREGRRLKANRDTWKMALDEFIAASDAMAELEQIFPSKHEVYYRLYMIFIPILMFIMGYLFNQ